MSNRMIKKRATRLSVTSAPIQIKNDFPWGIHISSPIHGLSFLQVIRKPSSAADIRQSSQYIRHRAGMQVSIHFSMDYPGFSPPRIRHHLHRLLHPLSLCLNRSYCGCEKHTTQAFNTLQRHSAECLADQSLNRMPTHSTECLAGQWSVIL